MAPYLSAIVLAAGLSSRMVKLKALLPLGATTAIEHCIQLFHDCGIEDVVVVTGHRAGEIEDIARASKARPVYNPDFGSGMYTSIQAGASQLGSMCSGFFLLPVDIPLVRRDTIKLLAEFFATSLPLITYPLYAGKRGHPPLISIELVSGIIDQHHPEGGLRSLLATIEAQHPTQVQNVTVTDANILFDMDTPDDYASGLQRLAHNNYPTMEE